MSQQTALSPPAGTAAWLRYRTIIISVALFLVFDLGVLVLNFALSARIESDAAGVNLAGRQRMLSQRMVKALILSQHTLAGGEDAKVPLDELRTTVQLFDSTLTAFDAGGAATGADGRPVVLAAVESASERDAVTRALALWAPYKLLIAAIGSAGEVDATALNQAVDYGRANNLALLGHMNDLTVALEKGAAARAERLRLIQVIGISLALVNFVIILFHFIRKLGEGDRRIEAARRETQEILDTVKEGLFLLGPDGRIGGQFSASLPHILHRELKAGEDFFALLKGMVPEAIRRTARDYVELLFAGRVKEKLVGDLNPLNRLEVLVEKDRGAHETRYLDIQFSRVTSGQRISHLLVTVLDITDRVRLEQAVEEAKRRAGVEVGLLMSALNVHPQELGEFLTRSRAELLTANDLLKNRHGHAHQYQHTVQAVFRAIHALKGEAAALGLESVEILAHDFEKVLGALQEREAIAGDDMLVLPVHLQRLLEHLELIDGIAERVTAVQNSTTPGPFAAAEAGLAVELRRLAERIAVAQAKRVQVETDLDAFARLPDRARQALKDVAIQLVRNAVVHGIEPPTERAVASKPEHGTISVALRPVEGGQYEFIVRDDGCGIQPERIRAALAKSGRYRPEELETLDERALAMKIFEPGFSTVAGEAGRDAGRGVGLDVVKARLAAVRARIRIATQSGRYTEFRIQLAA